MMWKELGVVDALQKLQDLDRKPSIEEFVCILQKCRKSKELAYARQAHRHIQSLSGMKTYECLGNHIVPMFVECGSITDAEQVFRNLVSPNVHSWTSLLVGYALHGRNFEAFDLYNKMQQSQVDPSGQTIIALIKACNGMQEIWEVHDEAIRKGLETEVFVGSSLISTYIKYNCLSDAIRIFNLLSDRNVVTWNIVIAGYAEHDGLHHEAIKCLVRMKSDGICPDDATFIGILKASSAMKRIDAGRVMHTETLIRGLERHTSIGNTLVDMYAKCGYVSEAQTVFKKMPVQTAVSWNAMIGGYIEQGCDQEGLNCFDQMEKVGCGHNSVTLMHVLKACANLVGGHGKGKEIHIEMTLKGYEREMVLCSTLVDMYMKNGSLEEAWATSCQLPFRDIVLWNTLISGYAEHDPGSPKVLECVERMRIEGIAPNDITFTHMLRASARCSSSGQGLMLLHMEIIARGFEGDVFVGSSLVDVYAKHGWLSEAKMVFDRLRGKTVVSWTALASGYAEYGFHEEALKHFDRAEHEGISPNPVMFASVLKACNGKGCIKQAQKLHSKVAGKGFDDETIVSNTLIDVYAKCCCLEDACRVFRGMPSRTVESWNAMINGFGLNEEGGMAMQVFEEMLVESKVKPNGTTYTCVLSACSHGSLVSAAREVFETVSKTRCSDEAMLLEAYSCMLDALARSGKLHEAEKLLQTVPCSPSLDMWLALFSACKTHEDLETGHRCFEQLKIMEPRAGVCNLRTQANASSFA